MRRPLLVLVSFTLMVACGVNPHDRAEAVMESVMERLTALHARADEIVTTAEARSPVSCRPVIAPLPGTVMIRQPRDVRPKMIEVHGEYMAERNQCLSSLRSVQRVLNDARSVRDRLSQESLGTVVTALRGRLATVSEDGLTRVLDAAGTDAEAWVALHQVNVSGGRGRVLNPDELELRFVEFEEQIDSGVAQMARSLAVAEEKRIEWYGLAGEPVPER